MLKRCPCFPRLRFPVRSPRLWWRLANHCLMSVSSARRAPRTAGCVRVPWMQKQWECLTLTSLMNVFFVIFP